MAHKVPTWEDMCPHASADFALIVPAPLRHNFTKQPPNALVVQLKRFGFTGTTSKIGGHVHFEEKLDLDVSGPERRVSYDLTG